MRVRWISAIALVSMVACSGGGQRVESGDAPETTHTAGTAGSSGTATTSALPSTTTTLSPTASSAPDTTEDTGFVNLTDAGAFSDDDTTATTVYAGPRQTVVVRLVPNGDAAADLQRAADELGAHVPDFGQTGARATVVDGGVEITLIGVPESEAASGDIRSFYEVSEVELRPVLMRRLGQGSAPYQLTPLDQITPEAIIFLTGREPNSDDLYQLGPRFADGTAVATAQAEIDNSTGFWQVSLTLTDAGLAAWNDMAAECFQQTDRCPDGGIALVLDGAVVSAPVPQISHFDSPDLSVTGSFDSREAKQLARILKLGATPPTLVVESVVVS